MEHKTEHNYPLVNQAINTRKSNKEVAKEIEHISNNKRQRFKGRKEQDRKMNKQKIQQNYNKNHYTEQSKQYKNKHCIIKDKNQFNDNKHTIGPVSKFLTTVIENYKKSKKIVHHKLKEYTMPNNIIQKISENYSIFSHSMFSK